MGELYEKIFWLNMFRNGGSYSAGTVAQPKTEWWLNLAGLSVQKGPEYSFTPNYIFFGGLPITAHVLMMVLLMRSAKRFFDVKETGISL